jgi:hypothetical protein
MIITLEETSFFKSAMQDAQPQTVIKEDAANGFEGNFQKIAKGWTNEAFLALYDPIISQFQEEHNKPGVVEKHLAWVNILNYSMDIQNHTNSLEFTGESFTLRHYIKLSNVHPRTHYIFNEEELFIDDIKENDVVIHPANVMQGLKQNLEQKDPMIVLTFGFSIKA